MADTTSGDDCQICDNPDPDPRPPTGGEESFTGSAIFTKDGQVLSNPAGGDSCDDCEWLVLAMCFSETGDGPGCMQRLDYCARTGLDGRPFSVWLTDDTGTSTFVDYICIDDADDIVTLADIDREIQQQWIAYVPEQRPSMQPPNGRALVNLPTIFDSGQPAEMPSTAVPVFNFTVNVTARGEWTWTFAPGVTETFDIPGSSYPDDEVSHTYTEVDHQTVILNTRWWGSFTVGEEGPWDIPTPAIQGPYELPVEVVETTSVLGG